VLLNRFRAYLRRLFNGLSVGQKVMTVIAVEILSYSVITTVAIYQIGVVGNEVKQMANVYLPLFSASESIRQDVQDKQLHMKDVVFVGDRVVYDKKAEETYISAKAQFLAASAAIDDQLSTSRVIIRDAVRKADADASVIETFEDALTAQLSKIRYANRINNGRVETIFRHVEDGSFLMGMELLEGVAVSEEALIRQLDAFDLILLDLKSASVDYTVGVEKASSRMTLLASILTVCVVIAIFFFVVKRNISRPLHTLTDAINTFDVRKNMPTTSDDLALMARGDELGMVSRSFDALKRDLHTQDAELRASRDAAEKADRAKSQFLAAASHDLRQPLHAMQMYFAALRRGLKKEENLAILEKVESVSITTGRLLNSLLDVSQLEAGAIQPQFEVFHVQELLRRVSLSFTPAAQQKNLEFRVMPCSLAVRSDPALLERIIGNFISNAIRYTRDGKILLGCRRSGPNVLIQVLDTGIGIPDQKIDMIFEDFYQVNNEERDRSKGLGLGLAIATRLADCLGHRIARKSNLGRGSCFGVSVEMAEMPLVATDTRQSVDFTNNLAGAMVMLIEDDSVVADATTQLLQSWGCEVIWAANAEQASNLVTSSSVVPDIVLADYRLPGGQDGLEVAMALQLATGRAIPTIIVTGESDLHELKEIADMGYLVIRKPVRPAKLRSLINHYLSQHEHQVAAR